jgi:glutamate transport system substrate-binding protein
MVESTLRRLHGILAVSTALALALTGCSQPEEIHAKLKVPNGYGVSAAPELPAAVQRIKDRGSLIVGTSDDQPGFGIRDQATGQIVGFDAEIARLIAIRIFGKPEVKFVKVTAADRPKVILAGTVDMVIATYTITRERAKVIGFVGPYFEAGQDILVRQGDLSVKSVEDLAGKRVCTQRGTTSLQQLEQAQPEAIIRTANSVAACADGVQNGTYDAVTTDNVILAGIAAERRGALALVGNRFSDEPYGIGIAKDDVELRGFINATLREIFNNGDWNRAWIHTLANFLGTAPEPPRLVADPGT